MIVGLVVFWGAGVEKIFQDKSPINSSNTKYQSKNLSVGLL